MILKNTINSLQIKVKKLHPDAAIPTYAKLGDAAMDLYAIEKGLADGYGNMVYKTGLAIEIPYGFVGLIFPRSSVSKTNHMLRNHVGVIDSGYRGELILKFGWFSQVDEHSACSVYDKGDRIGQLMIIPYPQIDFIEVEELSNSDRGVGGFGSTGS